MNRQPHTEIEGDLLFKDCIKNVGLAFIYYTWRAIHTDGFPRGTPFIQILVKVRLKQYSS